jgi:hypothetical protein
MSEDLEAIQASLKRLLASKSADSEAHAKALTVAMHGIQAALAELIEAGERSDEAAQKHADEAEKHRDAVGDAASRIVQAIGRVRVDVPAQPAPVVNVAAPTVTVEAPSVTVQAAPAPVNQITVEAPPERARPIRYEIEQEIVSGHVTGKTIVTPIYK